MSLLRVRFRERSPPFYLSRGSVPLCGPCLCPRRCRRTGVSPHRWLGSNLAHGHALYTTSESRPRFVGGLLKIFRTQSPNSSPLIPYKNTIQKWLLKKNPHNFNPAVLTVGNKEVDTGTNFPAAASAAAKNTIRPQWRSPRDQHFLARGARATLRLDAPNLPLPGPPPRS